MTRAPVRIRTFLIATVVALVSAPALAGFAAWSIARHVQSHDARKPLDEAVAYLVAHRTQIREPAAIRGFARLLERGNLLGQLVLASQSPPQKAVLYTSPGLEKTRGKTSAEKPPALHELIGVGTGELAVSLFTEPVSVGGRALAALVTGFVALLLGLTVAVWLAGRWMVAPLRRLSFEVDKVAGGDLEVAVPHSRVGEVANIAHAIEGMTAALGESASQRAQADEARRFLVTSVAHDLRTPLFALRGHLQAIRSHVGDPALHLDRAEARADALDRLVGNLFAYTRDDYAQPTLQLEDVLVDELLHDVAAAAEHTAKLDANTIELDGDPDLQVVVDRDRVKRALANILDNALRYSPEGAAVHLAWSANGDAEVEIAVRDEGPGIDDELLPHVFEPGVRADGLDGGAGLGLTIARRLLEHQGASVTVANRPDGGAEIRVALVRTPSHG
ncbi:MAG: HAMP domain-containing sensor histidine kinase [Actinomycetota bacterium]